MNNRKRNIAAAKRNAESVRRKRLHKLFDLALDINGTNSRIREDTGSLPTAFFDFSGHTGAAHVRVYSSGWTSETDSDYRDDVWEGKSINAAINRLEKLKLSLQDVSNEQP